MLKCQNSHLFLLSVVEMLKQVGTLYALLIPLGPGSRRSGGFCALAWWSGIWNVWFCWIGLLLISMVQCIGGACLPLERLLVRHRRNPASGFMNFLRKHNSVILKESRTNPGNS